MTFFKHKNAGFTLVEMLISVGIFTLISGLILANYPEFRSRNALDNLTAQVALVFREAQIYGISVRAENGSDFDTAYGVHIDLTSQTGNKEFIIFADKDRDRVFNPGGQNPDTVVETFRLTGGEYVESICAPSCVGADVVPVDSVTTVFIRPNPDAYFSIDDVPTDSVASISIRISNRGGTYKRNVEIFNTGQISIR